MAVDQIRYDILAQEALRGVVRRVLSDVAKKGLPGEHHFFITIDTTAPGVRISPRLREQYKQEITIVLQHQFWDLIVTEHGFEVGLSFNGVPERLVVPFDAVRGFFDPSVQFGLQFAVAVEEILPAAPEAPEPKSPKPRRAARPQPKGSVPAVAPDKTQTDKGPPPDRQPEPAKTPEPSAGAEVVPFDRFRKK